MRYPRAARITRRQDIERIRKEGRTLKTSSLVIRSSSSPSSFMRVGVVVPKFGHTAVERNRLKRRLRELVRDQLLPLPCRCDVVIWALPSAYRQNFDQLAVTLRTVVDRMGDCHAGVS